MAYATHQVITSQERDQTTIIRAGGYNEQHIVVHEAIIPLADAQAAREYQKSLINSELGVYDPINNSCLSHVLDVLEKGGGKAYSKTELGYGRFFRKNGFQLLKSDKTIQGGD
ncbi:hypothetical protein [Rheinheimera sp.]|uniref:hypothetical protein n=1 Tax=Rheinheimera sp. TaxID=1869214 RepID=UPI004047B2A1